MKKNGMKIGTRGSQLALFQESLTRSLLEEAHPHLQAERCVIQTTGDRRTDIPLDQVAKQEGVWDKGVFIKEIELALENQDIDIAVHSLKDLPTMMDPQFLIAAVLPREEVQDVLILREGVSWEELGEEHVIATSSPRRAAFLSHLRPGVRTCSLRGNVPTRLEKLASTNQYAGIILAAAGLKRLGYLDQEKEFLMMKEQALMMQPLDPQTFLPAVGQGAIALQVRANDLHTRTLVEVLNHEETFQRISAEREFLRLLNGGCHTPVGVYSEVKNQELVLHAQVFEEGLDALSPLVAHAQGPVDQFLELGRLLFERLQREESLLKKK